ncbi:MAG: DUF6056 family protein [Bdellovibrionota bacterium]|nr:DUF6056 family protein [Bdellovibrionota bacterium]
MTKTESLEKMLLSEKVETLWAGAPTSVIVGSAAGIFSAAIIFQQVNQVYLWTWLSALIITGAIRLFLAFKFRKQPDGIDCDKWLNLYFYSTAAVGTVWAMICFFVFGQVDPERETIISTVILAMSCGGAISSIADKKTAVYFSQIIIVSYSVNILLKQTQIAFLHISSVLFFLVFVFKMISQFNKLYENSNSMAIELQDKYELEQELQKEKNHAFQSSKLASLGEMAAGIAHEINNPLTVSLGKIQMLRKRVGSEDEKVLRLLESIEDSNVRISEIVFSMRNLSRMNDEVELNAFSPEELIKIVSPIIATKIKWNEVHLDIAMKEASIMGNKGEISQVMINLIHNAVDAIVEQDEKEKWINVTGIVEDGIYKIKVVNPGEKISPEVAEKLFEPFFTTKDVGKGTGLGLSLSKSLVERSHGTIQYLADEPNITFELRFPLA